MGHKMYWQYTISQTPVYEFIDTGIRVRRHRYTGSRHRYTSSQTPVYEFDDTGIRVHRHRKRESFAILGDLKLFFLNLLFINFCPFEETKYNDKKTRSRNSIEI